MGLKLLREGKGERMQGPVALSRSRMKLWMIRATTTILLWTCVVQLAALGDMLGPRMLRGWPSCFTPAGSPAGPSSFPPVAVEKMVLPPKSEFIFFTLLITLNARRAPVIQTLSIRNSTECEDGVGERRSLDG